jgi:hypothetical protein
MSKKICFNKSLGVVFGIVTLIIIGTLIVAQLTSIKTSTNSRADEPKCLDLLESECTGTCVWQNNSCVSLISRISPSPTPTMEQLEVCPKVGLECITENNLEYDWDTAGYAPCKTVDKLGIETKMRCCPKGLVRVVVDGKEPGVCDCPKGKQKGEFTSVNDEGKCVEYKKISKTEKIIGTNGALERCLTGLSCIEDTFVASPPRGALPCFNSEGIQEFCCQPGSAVTIPSDSTLKPFCRANAWYSIW